MKKTYYIFLLALTCISCSRQTFESEAALWEYLKNPDNGYYHQKNVNGYDFSLLYKPTDLLVHQELSKELEGEKRTRKIEELREKYGKYLYFSLSMAKGGQELLSATPKNRQEFGDMVNTLAFGMQEKTHLFTSKKDTIPLTDYIYPRMYGMSESTNILLVYPRDKKYLQDEYLNLTIGDLGMYTGEVKFKIETKKIDKQPQLELLKSKL